jgi:hypothetical protein
MGPLIKILTSGFFFLGYLFATKAIDDHSLEDVEKNC